MKHLFLILFIQFVFVHLDARPLGRNIAYSDDNVRFTVISDGVMRLEYSPDGRFVDNKSFLAVERVYPAVDYKVRQTRRSVEITTAKMKLTYKKGSGKFNSSNLEIISGKGMFPFVWKPGTKQKNNLKGAMADYDQVISMDHDNLIARFNRGLLRFQVGDNNRAIEDFDVVLQLEPDNYMAYYNRALLRYETGDYPGSVSDFNVVLTEYPDFLPGYYSRAEAKKKMNDLAGADRDVWTAFKKEEQMKKNRAAGKTTASASSGTATTGTSTSGNATDNNTREQSDKNIDKFNRLVVYDKEEERRNKFNSDVRGRVQDRNVRVDLEPQFILTFYEKPDPVKKQLYYSKLIDDFNQQMVLKMKLLITNEEAALTEDQIAAHFASIDDYSARIARNPSDVNSYLGRALDYMLVQDFASAIKDYDKVIELDPNSMIAFFNRAVVRYKQMQYQDSNEEAEIMDIRSDLTMNFNMGGKQTVHSAVMPSKDDLNAIKEEKRSYQHEQITRDYDMAIKLHPDFVYAYFNRGNLRCALRDYRAAIEDYSEAIRRDPEFAEAYFNRGLARLSQGNTSQGIADLSKAGELGIINAYSIIKRMME